MHFRHYFIAAVFLAASIGCNSQTLDTVLSDQAEISRPEIPKLPANLTDHQVKLLEQAYLIGQEDNHKNPELLQGILMQETKAGLANYKSIKNNCYGIFQIKVAAARDVLRNFPDMVLQFGINPDNTKAVINRLIHDDLFNTSVASKYLLLMKRYGFTSMRQLALAYNQGPGGAKNFNSQTHFYPIGVMKHKKKLNL